jgi:hypothetical protein
MIVTIKGIPQRDLLWFLSIAVKRLGSEIPFLVALQSPQEAKMCTVEANNVSRTA